MTGTSVTHALDPATSSLPPVANPWSRLAKFLGLVLLVALLAVAYDGIDMRPLEFWRDRANMVDFVSRFFPGTWAQLRDAVHDWRLYLAQMLVTLYMALWGSLLAALCAVPLALLASRNLAPIWIRMPVRRVMDALRAINELVFALMFVSAVGLGPMAGTLALWLHTTGILAKLFSEAVEAIDPRPVEGVRATGAGCLEEVAYGVVPQVMPLWISYTLYRFESNVRSATVVGLVGAGGIGQILHESMRSFHYQQAAAVLAIIVIAVVLVDMASGLLRRRFT